MEIGSVNSPTEVTIEKKQSANAEVKRADQKPAYEVEISQEAIDARNRDIANEEAIKAEQQAQVELERARAAEEQRVDDSGYAEPSDISG